jgi:hypothetical protein
LEAQQQEVHWKVCSWDNKLWFHVAKLVYRIYRVEIVNRYLVEDALYLQRS